MYLSNVWNFLVEERGLRPETLETFGVTKRDDGAVVFPYSNGDKVRAHDPEGKRSFYFAKGRTPTLFQPKQQDESKKAAFLVEGETDAMRLHQELNGAIPVYGLAGIETWRDEFADILDHEKVYVILDNDQDYMVTSRVDNAYRDIRAALGTRAKRVRLPKDVKDVCEFFNRYDMEALRLLAQRTPISGQSRFRTLDLTKEPPPVRWVVADLICRGDIHLVIGEPGIGKSWLTMALSVGIANEHESFLGKEIQEHGRVLYLDEENPEDLVFDRFRKLGMDTGTARNIRYINNFGIRLDGPSADDVIEEALDFEPTLVVLDSLTRFHTEDENHAGAMAKLFHNAIKPLARETGAAVILIHHANKTESNSSYKRSRGSGDITASVDCGYDVREIGEGTLAIANFKSRRQAQGQTIYSTILDTPEGGVKIAGGEVTDVLPF